MTDTTVPLARPAFETARRLHLQSIQAHGSAEAAFGESCLELLRVQHDESGSEVPFEQHLLDLGSFSMVRFTPTDAEYQIWVEYFGSTEEGTLEALKRVLDGVLRRNGIHLELKGAVNEEDPEDMMPEFIVFVPRNW